MSLLYYLNKPDQSHMSINEFITNPGFNHIMIQIMANLDEKDIANCRLVSKTWKNYIDSKQWWITQLEYIRNTKTTFKYTDYETESLVDDEFPVWKKTLDYYGQKVCGEKLKKFVNFMWQYFKNEKKFLNPLLQAVNDGNIGFIEFLIDSPIDFNVRCNGLEGICFHIACYGNQVQVLELLVKHSLDKNIDITTKSLKYGLTPMHVACKYGSLELVKALSNHIISRNLDLFQTSNNGVSLFHGAVENTQSEVPIYLLENFKVNFDNSRDENGLTLMHRAILFGQEDTVNHLLDSRSQLGINLNETSSNGENVVHFACQESRTDILPKLIGCLKEDYNGEIADVFDARDDFGKTPFRMACQVGNLDIVKMLLFSEHHTTLTFNNFDSYGLVTHMFMKVSLAFIHINKKHILSAFGILALEIMYFGQDELY